MDIMKRALFTLVASILSAAAPAASDPVTVEVFVSQNCPACPKAHENMAVVSEKRDDLLVLTWSVDYWDYLGAPDPMAIPEAKARQAAYADRFELRGPYTPQSVYDGVEQCPGNKLRRVEATIERRSRDRSPGPGFVQGQDGSVTLSGESAQTLDISLIRIADLPGSDMINPVQSVESLGTWAGETVAFRPDCETRCALIAQQADFGAIEAAVLIDRR